GKGGSRARQAQEVTARKFHGVPSLKCRRHGRASRTARVPAAPIDRSSRELLACRWHRRCRQGKGTSARPVAARGPVQCARGQHIEFAARKEGRTPSFPNWKSARRVGRRRFLLHQLYTGDGFEVLVVDLLAVGLGNVERVEDSQRLAYIHRAAFRI